MNKRLTTKPLLFVLLLMFFGLMFLGCSSSYTSVNGQKATNQESRLNKLTNFSIALTANQYQKAAEILITQERDRILDGAGNLYDGMDGRLNHLRLSTLVNDSSVRVINGKISGIYEILPMLEMGPPVKKVNKPLADSSLINIAPTVDKENSQKKLKMVWDNFMAAVRNQDFEKALDFIDAEERSIFFTTHEGRIKEGTRARLADLDTAVWQNLVLKNGKLERVWLLISAPTSSQEKASKEFIKHINMGHWKKAMDMLTDYEREYLSDGRGRVKEEFKRELKNLTSKDWESFYFFRGKLSGALDWLGLGQFGQKNIG
jgi:hypothetical protein